MATPSLPSVPVYDIPFTSLHLNVKNNGLAISTIALYNFLHNSNPVKDRLKIVYTFFNMDEYTSLSSDLINKSKLIDLIRNSFDMSELRSLCFELEVIYDDIFGERLIDKARELVLYMERQNRVNELVKGCKKLRPGKDWDSVYSPLDQPTALSRSLDADNGPLKQPKTIFTWRKASILLILVISLPFLLGLFLRFQCNEVLVSFRVSPHAQETVIVYSESKFTVLPEHILQISPDIEWLNYYTCKWDVGGDIEILDTSNCNLRLRTGDDDVQDTITLTLHQTGCRLDKVQNLFLVPTQ